jgi:hypothetical protein
LNDAAIQCSWCNSMFIDMLLSHQSIIFICTQTKQTGLSPLAPGQWKPFLAINAGFMVFQNLIRPVHVALAVIVSPYFDKIVDGFQSRFNFSRKASVIITALLANLVGTLALMGAGISIAATLAGVPVFP